MERAACITVLEYGLAAHTIDLQDFFPDDFASEWPIKVLALNDLPPQENQFLRLLHSSDRILFRFEEFDPADKERTLRSFYMLGKVTGFRMRHEGDNNFPLAEIKVVKLLSKDDGGRLYAEWELSQKTSS